MKRRILALLMVGACAVSLTACGGNSETSSSGKSSQAESSTSKSAEKSSSETSASSAEDVKVILGATGHGGENRRAGRL